MTQKEPDTRKPINKDLIRQGRNHKSDQGLTISPASQSLISVFVFALGLAAIVAVGYLAYTQLTPSPQSGQTMEQNAPEQIVEQPTERARPDASTLEKATLRQFSGSWVARSGIQIVYANIKADNTFEIVVFLDGAGYERRYSSGTYNYNVDEGVLNLRSSYDPLPELEGVRMKTLTRRNYGIIPLIDKKSGSLIWVAQNREDPSYAHPIFALLGRSDSYIVWSPRS